MLNLTIGVDFAALGVDEGWCRGDTEGGGVKGLVDGRWLCLLHFGV